MFFNNDLLFVVGSILVGGIFTYSFYNNIFTTNNSESLVNTVPNIDSFNLAESSYPILQPNVLHKIDVGVQTEAPVQVAEASVQATIHVDAGIQTSARIWYETVKNWITELLSIRSSELQGVTPTEVRVENWINNLDSTQLVSQNSMNSVVSNNQSNFGDHFLLEYAQSQTNFDIGSRAEYFNIISPQVDVTLENVMVNDTQYLFAVVKDVILTLDPNIFNLF
jgi:hypothetical protein